MIKRFFSVLRNYYYNSGLSQKRKWKLNLLNWGFRLFWWLRSEVVEMSAKNKKPDLHQKQVGCMNVLFHFFGGRRIGGQNHKRLLSGQNATPETKQKNTTEKPRETNQKEVAEEKQKALTESSRTSHSSTFTSAECNTTPQQEPYPPLLNTPPPISLKKHPNSSLHETRTSTRERAATRVMKHIDSPRPLPMSKFTNPKVSSPDGSFRPKDARRFSYDDREWKNKRKSSVKLKEIPRLSLDSRESSIRKSAYEPRPKIISADLQRGNAISSQTLIQEPGSNKRPSSVVAKLMGLEAFPDSTSVDNEHVQKIGCFQDKELDLTSNFSRKADNQASRSPRTPQKEPSSLQLRSKSSTVVKANSRVVALEPAPWRHKEGKRKPDGNKKEDVVPSVYGEIEKRLTELEFKRSGKDLRALKQILEAMQKNRRKLEKCSTTENQTSQDFSSPKTFKSSIMVMKPAGVVKKPSDSATLIEGLSGLQIRRTKEKENSKTSFLDKQSAKSIRNNHFRDHSSPAHQSTDKTLNESGATTKSPRLHQKKHRMESQCRSSVTPKTDSNRTRRYISNHQTESVSPRRNMKPKSPRAKTGVDISKTTPLKWESNRSSALQKETEVKILDSPKDISRTFPSKDQRNEVTAIMEQQPSPISVLDASFYGEEPPSPVKKISHAFPGQEILYLDEAEWNLEDLNHWVNEGRPYAKADFQPDKSKSDKHFVQKLREEKTTKISPGALTNPDHMYIEEIMSTSGFLTNLRSSSMFVQLHPSGHLINPDLFLVLEQMKGSTEVSEEAQGDEKVKQSKLISILHRKMIFDMVDEILTREMTSASFTEAWISPKKLGVGNLSGQKLLKELFSEMDHLLRKPDKCLLDLDHDDALTSIIRADTMNRKENWEDCQPEIPGIVLDVERLIFKDLVGEILNTEMYCFPDRSTKTCRQLFPQ